MLGKIDLVRKVYVWILGNENCINFWYDIWMNKSPLINKIRPDKQEFVYNQAKVNGFIDTTKKWQL